MAPITMDETRLTTNPLLGQASLEMTSKDVPGLEQLAATLAPGTRVNVTFLATEDEPVRVAAAAAVAAAGLSPVPHISARRLRSDAELTQFLTALAAAGAIEHVFAVGGDPAEPAGPYADALALIRSGLLQAAGVRRVSISGYPEGHPDIDTATLWDALQRKAAALAELGMADAIITQFGFDADTTLGWIEQVRERKVLMPVRIGVPGPAGVKRLLGYARRFGVGTSAGIARKYGLSLTNLMATAGPDRYVNALAEAYDPARHGQVQLHFYTFGGLGATADWIQGATAAAAIAAASGA